MRNGQARRELMMRYIRRRGGIHANRRGCFSTEEATIAELLKKGLLKQTRQSGLGSISYTILKPADGVYTSKDDPLVCPECQSHLCHLCKPEQHRDTCSMRQHTFGIYKGARRINRPISVMIKRLNALGRKPVLGQIAKL